MLTDAMKSVVTITRGVRVKPFPTKPTTLRTVRMNDSTYGVAPSAKLGGSRPPIIYTDDPYMLDFAGRFCKRRNRVPDQVFAKTVRDYITFMPDSLYDNNDESNQGVALLAAMKLLGLVDQTAVDDMKALAKRVAVEERIQEALDSRSYGPASELRRFGLTLTRAQERAIEAYCRQEAADVGVG